MLTSNRFRQGLLISLFILFFAGGISTHLFAEDTLIHRLDLMPPVCPLRALTGFLCSFCGMTHAWIYFWHGDWMMAFQENKLSLLLFTGFPLVLLSLLSTNFWTEKRIRPSVMATLLILVAYTIGRNISL